MMKYSVADALRVNLSLVQITCTLCLNFRRQGYSNECDGMTGQELEKEEQVRERERASERG